MKYQVENKVIENKRLMQSIIVIFALMLAISIFPSAIQASDKETEKALQRYLEESSQSITGRPLGSEGFMDNLEKRLGRALRPRKAGRKTSGK
jgi:hypothetical protein